jgi:putative transposase
VDQIPRRKTDSDHTFNIAPTLLQQDFAASQPNQKWAGDITYVWTREGWIYLAVILDLHSRRVIGWAISNRMKKDLAIRALNMAIRCPAADVYIRERGPAQATQGLHSPHGSR